MTSGARGRAGVWSVAELFTYPAAMSRLSLSGFDIRPAHNFFILPMISIRGVSLSQEYQYPKSMISISRASISRISVPQGLDVHCSCNMYRMIMYPALTIYHVNNCFKASSIAGSLHCSEYKRMHFLLFSVQCQIVIALRLIASSIAWKSQLSCLGAWTETTVDTKLRLWGHINY